MSYRTFSHNSLFARGALLTLTLILSLGIYFGVPALLRAEETPPAESTTPATAPEDTGTGSAAEVTTGNATSSLDTDTEANTNNTDMSTPAGSEVTTTNDNDATASTTGIVESATGDNSAEAIAGASLNSGNALSVANIVNVINTNIFNSEGLLYFLNVLMGNVALDLRTMFSTLTTDGGATSEDCSLGSCTNDHTTVTVQNQNTALVDNTISVTASTGNNTASSTAGNASITTGNAYASANVVNVVNTNITNSNYLLLSINNFGAFGGDVVFPGAEWFRDLLSAQTPAGSETQVTNTNTATVTNNGEVVADTGNNTTSGTTSTITTGDSHAAANVINQVNTNIFGDSMLFLFRIHGTWAGNIFGLPEGMQWREGAEGVELFLDPQGVSSPQGSTDHLTVENTNTATVTNNVSVFALTGENHATSTESGAQIKTGDAYASANIVNVVNTNILGRNWVLAIFNIFGDWSGNISFGQPDLWVGARALIPSDIRSGSCFDYEVTVNNLGDAVATDVQLSSIFNTLQQDMPSFGGTATERINVPVGRIPAKGTRLLTINSCVLPGVSGGSPVHTSFTATSRETDANTTNNSDAISFTTIVGAGSSAFRNEPSQLTVEKSTNKPVITASTTVDYTVTITNKGGPVYNALLVDTIYNPDGVGMHEQRWGLGTIAEDEEITVTYSTFFNGSTTRGVYKNEAFVFGVDRHPDTATSLGNKVTSSVATAGVLVRTQEEIDAQPAVCVPLLTSYIRYGSPNDLADVRDLQTFLSMVEKNNTVHVTGEYDLATYQAVHAFQNKYAGDILTPWGVTRTTGFVYYTTQKKINELWCNQTFPLAPAQEAEITAFKQRVQVAEEQHTPLPETEFNEIGMTPEAPSVSNIAMTPEAAPTVPEESLENTQVASVGGASNSLVQHLWGKVRTTIGGVFSWLGF